MHVIYVPLPGLHQCSNLAGLRAQHKPDVAALVLASMHAAGLSLASQLLRDALGPMSGCRWRMLYSSIRILGTKRSRLGLREFVQVGDVWQDIDAEQNRAINKVEFGIAGFPGAGNFTGALVIQAGFSVESSRKAVVDFEQALLQPEQLQSMFSKHMDMLLSIFNPAGTLEVTFLDDQMRIGHDDKGNVFVLEKVP